MAISREDSIAQVVKAVLKGAKANRVNQRRSGDSEKSRCSGIKLKSGDDCVDEREELDSRSTRQRRERKHQ